MHLFHSVRKFVNRVMSPAGMALERVPKTPWTWPPKIVPTKIGSFTIEVPSANPVSWHYEHLPYLASHLYNLTKLVRSKYPNCGAIDVGANVGDTACIIKSAEDLPLICIEGEESTFQFLQRNVAQFKDAKAWQLFLGEKTMSMAVDFENAGWNLTLKPVEGSAAKSIQLRSMDDFMAEQENAARYKLLKVDTEGFDCSILRGALGFLGKAAPVITFEYNRGNMDAIGEPGLPTLAALQGIGYSDIVFHDQDGRFLLATTLENEVLVKDLHEYADCVKGRVGYLDITVFHAADADLAQRFVDMERSRRTTS